VNSPTFSCTRPAAAARTGQGSGAPPVRNSLPFAALPHELRKDPRLKGNRTAVVLAAALLEYARDGAHCWPSNRRLAEDLGVCQQTVRNALATLQAAGWCRVEHGVGNPTGRLIWLCWRGLPEATFCSAKGKAELPVLTTPTPSNRLGHPLKPVGGTPLKPVGPEARNVIVEPREEPDTGAGARSRPETPPTSVAPREQPVPIAEALPSTPPAPAPRPESEPTPLPDCRSESPGPSPAEPTRWVHPQPEPPVPPATPGPGAARPVFRRAPAGSPTHPRSEPAPGREKALPLTPEEKARLEAMDPGVRDQILTWLMLGDPILMREARAKLAPPRPKPEAPTTLPGILARIREDPSYPGQAAAWLARDFSDPKSYNGFLARCHEAWQGLIPVPVLEDAYRQATGPKVRNPGAIFQVACQRRE
jgi:hypothetical protein